MLARSPSRTPKAFKIPRPENLTERILRPSIAGMTIQGKRVGSVDELWTSWALDRLIKENIVISYSYQVSVFGGRSVRGGNVVDFVVETAMLTYLLDPMGRPFHTKGREDRWQMQNVATRKGWVLVAWFTDEHPDPESIYRFLKLKIR